MNAIRIKNGVYRNRPVNNISFRLVKGYTSGSKGNYVTVDSDGYFGPEFKTVRIRVDAIEDFEYTKWLDPDPEVGAYRHWT